MTTLIKGKVASELAKLSKVNDFTLIQNLLSGLKIGDSTNGVTFDPALLPAQELLTVNKGMYVGYTSAKNTILYGFASDVFRSSGSGLVVGGQFSAYVNPGVVGNQPCFGVVSQAWAKPGSSVDLVGGELAVINETSFLAGAKIALNIIFKNRPDGALAVTNGLGTNGYNANSIGLWLSSQPRSTSGEKCGFRWGIKFDHSSLDNDVYGGAVGIDFGELDYLGTPDPLLAYKMTAAIRMRPFQSIYWNADPAGPTSPTDSVNPVRMYFDSVTADLKLTNSAIDVFGIDVFDGNVTMKPRAILIPDNFIAPALLNSWVNFGGTTGAAGYTLDRLGNVTLQGSVKSGTVGDPIFVLPVGYRPVKDRNFAVTTNTGASSVYGNIGVLQDGTVALSVGSNTYVCLDQVKFNILS